MVKKWKLTLMCLTGTTFICMTCGCTALAAALAGLGVALGGGDPAAAG